jgi:transposase
MVDFCRNRINHSASSARGQNHINGLENFWGRAKRGQIYDAASLKNHSCYKQKECEFRLNYLDSQTTDENTLGLD